MKDKRTSKRSAIELAASFGIGEDPRPARQAQVSGPAEGGLCLIAGPRPKVGAACQVAVDLDVREQVVVSVEVVWVQKLKDAKKYRVGVRIIESDGPEFERFMEFYKRQI